MNKQPIYFDMDGVLVDLDKFFHDRYGSHNKDLDRYRVFADLETLAPDHLFQRLEPMPDFPEMKKLMELLKSKGHPVHILSSCTENWYHDIVSADKAIWLNSQGIYENSIFCDTFIFVQGSKMKAEYAPGILIDDWHKAGMPFAAKEGGYWLKHTNFYDTLKELNSVLSDTLPTCEWWARNVSEQYDDVQTMPIAPHPQENVPQSWVCNECGSAEYTTAVSQEIIDAGALACGGCGCDEFHLEPDLNFKPGALYDLNYIAKLDRKRR